MTGWGHRPPFLFGSIINLMRIYLIIHMSKENKGAIVIYEDKNGDVELRADIKK